MSIKPLLGRIHSIEERAHTLTLFLVALSLLADLASRWLKSTINNFIWIKSALHWVHYASLALVLVYYLVR